jgi:hypothetical protein
MSKLSNKTMQWLLDAEKQYLDGMPSVTDENRLRLMQIGLDAVREELKARQKKSEPQPAQEQPNPQSQTEKSEFLRKQAEAYRESGNENLAKKAEAEAQDIEELKSMMQTAVTVERVLVATVAPSAVVQVPAVAITLKRERTVEKDGRRTKETVEEVCTMTQGEILTKLKTDFKGLVNTPGWLGKKYTEGKAGVMGYNVRELFKGWNAIHQITGEGEPWPLITEVYAGYNQRTSQDQRVGCEVLWRWSSGEW